MFPGGIEGDQCHEMVKSRLAFSYLFCYLYKSLKIVYRTFLQNKIINFPRAIVKPNLFSKTLIKLFLFFFTLLVKHA